MRIALDYDGVISANFVHYYQLASDMKKSNHPIYIITASNLYRAKGISYDLDRMHFPYDFFITRPVDFISSDKTIGEWKKEMLVKHDIDLWFDNEIKNYEQAGVDFSDVKTVIVRI